MANYCCDYWLIGMFMCMFSMLYMFLRSSLEFITDCVNHILDIHALVQYLEKEDTTAIVPL